jgi:DNA polymerase bacteriophage-type
VKLWLDLESYSPTPLKSGTHIYAEPVEEFEGADLL